MLFDEFLIFPILANTLQFDIITSNYLVLIHWWLLLRFYFASLKYWPCLCSPRSIAPTLQCFQTLHLITHNNQFKISQIMHLNQISFSQFLLYNLILYFPLFYFTPFPVTQFYFFIIIWSFLIFSSLQLVNSLLFVNFEVHTVILLQSFKITSYLRDIFLKVIWFLPTTIFVKCFLVVIIFFFILIFVVLLKSIN